ncbi:hypothetical protein V5N11_005319 [Cardamine amara subsp. amara]|uniref:Hydroxyproline-rich glycoprotein family protein n=1 Tax=Cardamine amara subsp. amara TaxID=228776 RepID=A0ABD1CB60_CARAN
MLFSRKPSNNYFQPIKGQSSHKVSKSNKQDIKSSSSSPKTTSSPMPIRSSKSVLSGSNLTSSKRVSSPIGNIKNVSLREAKSPKTSSSPKWTGNFILMVELHRKMFTFRDIIDLPPLDGSLSITDMVMLTMKDLQKLCPEIIHSSHISEIRRENIDKVLDHFFYALKSIGDSWIDNPEWIAKSKYWSSSVGKNKSDRLVEQVLAALNGLIKMSKERLDIMEIDEQEEKKELTSPRKAKTSSSLVLSPSESFSDSRNSFCGSPITPISVLPESMMGSPGKFGDFANSASHLLWKMRAQALEKLSPTNVKRLTIHNLSQKEAQEPNQSNGETKMNVVDDIKQRMDEKESIDVKMVTEESVALDEEKDNIMKISSLDSTSTSKLNLSEKTENAPEYSPPSPMRLANGAPPPLPQPPVEKRAAAQPLPPPRMGIVNGAAAPPPPPGILRSKKTPTKLKRSKQLGQLYFFLKGKLEGRDPAPTTGGGSGRKAGGGSAPAGGKQGMADALAEITKKSAYFQQIQADIAKYMKSINELKIEITKFKTKDMTELLSFHRRVESVLENLTDETKVLAGCEGFPQKKLEAIRMAAALYLKLHGMITELQNWKIEPPLNQLLDKIERYFTKIKVDIDTLDQTKDEEAKKFQSHNIHFDFNILIQIKETMVDISSNCMELALKEKRDEKLVSPDAKPSLKKTVGCAKILWRAFQFAFKVYTFAGGHDDRADSLTKELAHEIQTDSENPC